MYDIPSKVERLFHIPIFFQCLPPHAKLLPVKSQESRLISVFSPLPSEELSRGSRFNEISTIIEMLFQGVFFIKTRGRYQTIIL